MYIQYTVLGFEPTTFGHESPPITIRPGFPPYVSILDHCLSIIFCEFFCIGSLPASFCCISNVSKSYLQHFWAYFHVIPFTYITILDHCLRKTFKDICICSFPASFCSISNVSKSILQHFMPFANNSSLNKTVKKTKIKKKRTRVAHF